MKVQVSSVTACMFVLFALHDNLSSFLCPNAAYDNRNPNNPTFYITTDASDGPLVKFTPATAALTTALTTGDFTNLLHTSGPGLKREFLVLGLDYTYQIFSFF